MRHTEFFYYSPRTKRCILFMCAIIALLIVILHLLQDRQKNIYIENLEKTIDSLQNIQQEQPNYAINYPQGNSHDGWAAHDKASEQGNAGKASGHKDRESRGNWTDRASTTVTPKRAWEPDKKENSKFTTATWVDINRADSAILQKVPGIGLATAQRIIRYREKLGGFHSADQLEEAIPWADTTQLNEWKRHWLRVEQQEVRKLAVNNLSFKELLQHPYLNYEQVKAIFKLRDDLVKIHNWKELGLHPAFSKEDVERLRPYIIFD